MDDRELDALITSGTNALGIVIDPAWHGAIRANLAVTLRFAALVEAQELPDDAEPAPVFRA